METLGIDIGGSGIKGAPVNVATGELTCERLRIPTPESSVPEAISYVVGRLVHQFNWTGPVGCTFPAVVRDGVVYTAANVDTSWIGTNGQTLLQVETGCPVVLLNDADAAGIAEIEFGAGRGNMGVVIVLTFGTGIGSAIFVHGQLLPNTELGHLEMEGQDAEWLASDHARQINDLSWKKWAKRVNKYLGVIERLFSPDLIIFGGGVSKKHEEFFPMLKTRARLVPAQMLNNAGIVGAALAARSLTQ